jgi:hypothetical protein
MLETIDVGTQDLDLYEGNVGAEAQLREHATPLEGAYPPRQRHPLRRRGRRAARRLPARFKVRNGASERCCTSLPKIRWS